MTRAGRPFSRSGSVNRAIGIDFSSLSRISHIDGRSGTNDSIIRYQGIPDDVVSTSPLHAPAATDGSSPGLNSLPYPGR